MKGPFGPAGTYAKFSLTIAVQRCSNSFHVAVKTETTKLELLLLGPKSLFLFPATSLALETFCLPNT